MSKSSAFTTPAKSTQPSEGPNIFDFAPYAQQAEFPFGQIAGTSTLNCSDSPDAVSTLQRAIEIARKMWLTEVGIRVAASSLQQPATPSVSPAHLPPRVLPQGTIVQSATRTEIELWFSRATFVVVLDELDPDVYAEVDPAQALEGPLRIDVNQDIVKHAGEARRIFGADGAPYQAALFHLGCIMFHEIFHCIRLHLGSVETRDTPPNIRTGRGDLYPDRYHRGRYYGEGGWYGEEHVIGGEVSRIMVPEGRLDYRTTGQVSATVVRLLDQPTHGSQHRYFFVEPSVIRQLVSHSVDLDQFLPLRPAKPSDILVGTPRHVKWRGPAPTFEGVPTTRLGESSGEGRRAGDGIVKR